jgi:hypothetical protein
MAHYTIELTLTDAQDKAFRFVALDPHDWIQNCISHRINTAAEKIWELQCEYCLQNPDISSMPTSKEQAVDEYFARLPEELHGPQFPEVDPDAPFPM